VRAAHFLLLVPAAALAAPLSYTIAPHSDGTLGIRFRLPYSLGTHDGRAKEVTGRVMLDGARAEGAFSVPIAALDSDHSERDCHMRESLGLDYERSAFPERHVCDDDDRLPETGADSVAYPEIRFRLTGISSFARDKASKVDIDGDWTIHGITRSTRMPMTLKPEENGVFRLTGEATFPLQAYGIHVKPAKVVFVTISAGELATAEFDLRLAPEKGKP
jgi:polyisoprenoid-binding protein YceI